MFIKMQNQERKMKGLCVIMPFKILFESWCGHISCTSYLGVMSCARDRVVYVDK